MENALAGRSAETEPLSVSTGVILAYVTVQVLLMVGWIVGGLYLLELLNPLPGGWIIAIAIILGGVGTSPNIAQWILMTADRQLRSMVARVQIRETEEEAAKPTKTDVQYRPGKNK